MQQFQHSILTTLICIFYSMSLFSQSEVVYEQIAGDSSYPSSFTPSITTQIGNDLELAGSNRYVHEITYGIFLEQPSTEEVTVQLHLYDFCPAPWLSSGNECGLDSELYGTVTSVIDLSNYNPPGQYFKVVFTPTYIPNNFHLSLSTDRSDLVEFIFGDSAPTIGNRSNSSLSKCGFSANEVTCDAFTFNEPNNMTLVVGAVPSPVIPITVTLPNDINQVPSVSIEVSDIYIGDANFVPTQSITLSQSTFTCDDLGVNNVTLTITFPNGDVRNYSSQVTVIDNSPPITATVSSNSPVCTGETLNLSVTPAGQGPFTYEWSGPGGTFVNGDTANPSVVGAVAGEYAVTITNYCGSVTSSTTVTMNTPPVINVTDSYNLDTDPGLCTAIIPDATSLFSLVSASGTPTPVLTLDFNPNTQFPVGLSTVPVSATNTCGTDQATIDINVIDQELPTAVCKDINIEVSDVFTTLLASDIDGGSSDACGIALRLVNGQQGGNAINSLTEGLQLVNLTVIDFNGNTASCDAEVTVVKDLCQEGDDGMDSDGGGLPDACDCSPDDAFNDNIILRNNENIGMNFDGIDDFLSIPNDPSLIPTTSNSMTFEAWINPAEVSGFQAIATSANVGTLSTYHFAINLQNDKVRVITLTSSLVVSNASIPANAWTHVAVVFTGHPTTPSLSTTEIYINGVSDNLVTGSFQAGNFGYPIILGNIDEFNLPYNGSLEEVRFWSSARTAAEIQLLKDRELSGMETDLEAYYNFGDGIPGGDNTALTSVKDLSPNSFDASLSGFTQNGPSSNWINGNVPLQRFYQDTLSPCVGCPDGIAMDFDGVDDHISIPNANDLVPTNNNSMTFEAWINPDQVTGFQSIASSANNLSVYNLAIYLLNDRVRVTASGGKLVLSNASIPVNTWTHVAVVFTANPTSPSLSKIEIYINGVLDNSLTDSFESNNLGNPIILGNINGANWIYNGKMDDLRFWSSARTMDQISNYMNTQLTGAEENLVAYYNFNTGIPDGNNSSLTVVPDGTQNERDGTLNGFAKNGTGSNWVASSNMLTAPENIALSFDGIDDHLTILNQPNLIATNTQSVTFEAWIYPEKAAADVSMIYATGIFDINNKNQIYLFDDKVNITSLGLPGMVSNASIPSFEWSHIAVVFDKTETRLYVNGELDQTRTGTLTSDNTGFNISLGNQENGLPANWNFLGKMDDVRMWGTARSESQIFDDFFSERTGLEEDLGAYFNFNNGIPEGDNSTIISAPDITGNGGGAVLNGFAKMGSISNFVSSPHQFIDFDADGTPDYCDNCIAPKNLIIRNTSLDGIYRATETITLGENLNFPSNGILTFRAPTIIIPDFVQFPLNVAINLEEIGCEE